MAKRNNLDNFFREKLSGYETSERQGNWQLMNHMLDARERRRKMGWRIFFGSLFVACLFLSYFLLFMPGNKKNKDVAVRSTNSVPAIHAPSVADSAAKENSNAVKAAPANENNSTVKSPVSNSSKNKVVPNKVVEATPSNSQKGKEERAVARQTKDKVNVTAKKKTNTTTAAHKNDEPTAVAKVDVNISKKNDASAQNENEKAGEEETTTLATPPPDSAAKDVLKDSTIAKNKNQNHSVPFFNVLAGLNLYRTQSPTLSDERHVSPLVGFELMYPLSQHLSAGLGMIYSLQGGYHLSDTATQVTFFLEKNVSQQVILIRKQHKLYVPLTLYYQVAEKHTVSAGIQWSYLLNTVGDYSESETESGNTTLSKKDNVKGYMDGIKSSAFSLSIGYRFSLSKRFDISTRLIQDLSDSYTPQYFYGVNTDPSWSLQTFLSVKF